MGQYVILRDEVIVRPCFTTSKQQKGLKYLKMTIGDNVYVDRGSVIQALSIGSNVHIGKNCIIGQRCIIRENCKIQDGSILAPDTVVPPNCVYGGQPATYLGELPESIA